MKILIYFALALFAFTSCTTKSYKMAEETSGEQISELTTHVEDWSEDRNLINTVYNNFVFAIDCVNALSPENYFTAKALKKLQADYEFDCEEEPCYAFYALRTEKQDSKPGTDGTSEVISIEPEGNSRYIVSYSDMGWQGKTRIKIINGKIDNYERIALQLD